MSLLQIAANVFLAAAGAEMCCPSAAWGAILPDEMR